MDYFHLPLLVRENTILPVGKEEERPDYDYHTDTVLKVYEPKEGVPAEITIPDMNGQKKIHIQMSYENGKLRLTSDGGKNLSVVCETDKNILAELVMMES